MAISLQLRSRFEAEMFGPEILVSTLSVQNVPDKYGNLWNYHSRSDHHSKVACLGVVVDLLRHCGLLRKHVSEGRVVFGINHKLSDFKNNREKKLDLVLCTPAAAGRQTGRTLGTYIDGAHLALTSAQRSEIAALPPLLERPVGAVLVALEAKACMTAHQRALPRLYDELNSSQLTVHGAHQNAIAAGFVMINAAEEFVSSDMNKQPGLPLVANRHKQPRDTLITIDKTRQLPRRANVSEEGYDALSIVVVAGRNDGGPFRLVQQSPAPPVGDTYHYASMIDRIANLYATRFAHI